MKYTIKRNNKDIATVSPTGSLNCKIMAEEVVQMQFVLPEYIDFKIGDTISVYGTTYVLNQEPNFQKVSTINYAFELQFESFKYDLNKVLCLGLNSQNQLTETDYAIMGDPMMLLKHLVANANRLGGGWKVGFAEKMDPKNISFNNHNILSALSMCAEEFETEYWVDGDKTIHLIKKQAVSGLSLKYGMSQGLRTISRTTLDSSNVLTRLYAQGSTQNIPVKYRYGSARLKMDVPFLEKNIDKFGLIEFSKTFEDIYPKRNGKVTAVFADDPFRFVDSSQDFDLNGTTSIHGEVQPILLPGVSAKVTFNTGQLAGYTFEIKKHGYDHSKKSFVLLKNKDEKAYEVPNDLLKPAVGDQYVLTDIVMPEVYITNAETELKKNAQDYLNENSVPRLQYAVQSDPIYFENQNINLQLGNTIKFVDADFGLDADIRVVSITKDLQNPYVVEFSIAEEIQQQKIVRDYIEKNKKEQEIRESRKKFSESLQRNYEFSQEIQENVFDAEGYFDPANIKPLSIETKMLSVGAREQQFTLEDLTLMVEASNTALRNTKGQIIHYTLEDKPRSWNIPASVYNGISSGFNFIYIKAQKVGNNASVFVSPNQIKVDQDAAFYLFEAGYLSSIANGYRKIRLSNGFTNINGREITTGRITSANGASYFDLDTGEIKGKITFTDGSGAIDQVTEVVNDAVGGIEVGGRNLVASKSWVNGNIQNGVNVQNGDPLYMRTNDFVKFEYKEMILSVKDDNMKITGGVFYYDENKKHIEGANTWVSDVKTIPVIVIDGAHYFRIVFRERSLSVPVSFENTKPMLQAGNKPTAWTPATEDLEAQIKDQEVYIEYSINGTTGWHFPMLSSDNYSRQRKGDGPWSIAARITGIEGKPGVDGKDGSQGPKGSDGINGAPGKAGSDGKTTYIHTAYANSADGRVGFSLSDSKDKAFWGNYTDFTQANSTDPLKYNWVKVRGEGITSKTTPPNPYEGMLWIDTSKTPSEQKVYTGGKWVVVGLGIDDIQIGGRNLVASKSWVNGNIRNGVNVQNGDPLYMRTNDFVKFEYKEMILSVKDDNMKIAGGVFYYDENKKHIEGANTWVSDVKTIPVIAIDGAHYFRIAFREKSLVVPINFENTKPMLQAGNKPTAWTPATEDLEAQIKDQEVYIEYSINGTTGWHFPMLSSDNYSRQRKGDGPWSIAARITGIEGKPGVDGKDGSQGPKGSDGINGAPGKAGVDGKTTYIHTAYANSADGRVGFSLSDSKDKAFWGNYTDFTQVNSTDPLKYNWVKVRGEGITSKTTPPNPYEGMLWIDTSKTPSEQKVFTGGKWVVVGLGIDDIQIGGRNLVASKSWVNGNIQNGVNVQNGDPLYMRTNDFVKFEYKEMILSVKDDNMKITGGVFYYDENKKHIEGTNTWVSDVKTIPVIAIDGAHYFRIAFREKSLVVPINFENTKPMLQAGNKPTAWSPAPEDIQQEIDYLNQLTNQQQQEIDNAKKTAEKLQQVTSYMVTTIDGGVVTTATLEVGATTVNSSGETKSIAKAGLTGVASSNPVNVLANRRVVFYAGTGFANRENAKVQIWDDGFAELNNARIRGHIEADSGYFKGRVEADSGFFRGHIEAETGFFKGRIKVVEGEIGSFFIDDEYIQSEMILPIGGAKAEMKLGKGGLNVTYTKGSEKLGEVNINGWDYRQGVGYMARIESFGREPNGTSRTPLKLVSDDIGLVCEGHILALNHKLMIRDIDLFGDINVMSGSVISVGIDRTIKVRSGSASPAYYNLTFRKGILTNVSSSN